MVDERRGDVDVGRFDKLSLTEAACRALGLHASFDVGWRCGDYSFYLARKRFPDERYFWLMEFDVRLAGPDLGAFFDCFAGADGIDLLAGKYREAASDWYWTHAMASSDQAVWRCFFPVVRLTARAVDRLLAERRGDRWRWVRRRGNWPNDESFVATTLSRAGYRCADLNDFGCHLYDEDSYSYHRPLDGDKVEAAARSAPPRLFHPVLFGEDLRRKINHLARLEKGESLLRKAKRRLIGAINHRLPA